MDTCIAEIQALYSQYKEFFEQARKKALRAAEKLGVKDWIEGMVYINKTCKSNGKCYAYLELYGADSKKKVGLGPVDKLTPEIIAAKVSRLGLSLDDINAMFLVKKYKSIMDKLERIRYFVDRIMELASELKFSPEELVPREIQKLKAPEVEVVI